MRSRLEDCQKIGKDRFKTQAEIRIQYKSQSAFASSERSPETAAAVDNKNYSQMKFYQTFPKGSI